MISEFLTRPISFHAPLVDVAGSVNAGLMLSQALFWTRVVEDRDTEGWFFKRQEDWYKETRLSRHEQDSARKRLKSLCGKDGVPLWEERLSGVPAKLFFRLNLEVLDELLIATRDVGRNLDCYEAANKIAEKRQTGLPENGKLYIENTLENTLEDILSAPQADADCVSASPIQQGALLGNDVPAKPARTAKAPKPPKEPKPAKEKKPNQHWEFTLVLAEIFGMDAKMNAGRLGREVKKLLDADYTIDDVKWFAEKEWPKDWRCENGQKLNEMILNAGIKQAKENRLKAPPPKQWREVKCTNPFTGKVTMERVFI